MIILSTNFCFN